MNFRLVVRPEVDEDLLEAEAWYEQQRAWLGKEFLEAVRDEMAALCHNPLRHRVRQRRRQVRWAYPKRFPYRIVFRVVAGKVVVYAVVHAARHDRLWKERL